MNTVIYLWQVFNKTKYHLKYLLQMLDCRLDNILISCCNLRPIFKTYYEY